MTMCLAKDEEVFFHKKSPHLFSLRDEGLQSSVVPLLFTHSFGMYALC